MTKVALQAALFASFVMCAMGTAAAQSWEADAALVAGATTAPPDLRYQVGRFVPADPDAFYNEADESGYSSGRGENPHGN